MNELIDKFLFELFDGLRDKTTVLFGEGNYIQSYSLTLVKI